MSSDIIRLQASTKEHARSLSRAVVAYEPHLIEQDGEWQVELTLDTRTGALVIELFDAIGAWLGQSDVASCRVHFGERSLTMLAPAAGQRGDPTDFLLERTIQLQRALESRVVIEQAKGVLAERLDIGLDEAFAVLRQAARSARMKLHVLAGEVVASAVTPAPVAKVVESRLAHVRSQ
jgi:ANTAR domain